MASPTVNIGGVFGALRSGGSFFSFATSMDKLNQEVMIGLPKNAVAQREGGDTIPLWRLFGILEYGAPQNRMFGRPAPIPPRPAVTKYLRRRRKSINRRLANIVKGVAVGKKYNRVVGEYSAFAAGVVKEIQSAIITNREKPNSPQWAAIKGFNRPLFHFGGYVSAWTYKVTKRRTDVSALRKAQQADKALKRVSIGDGAVSGSGTFWSQLR